MASGPILFAYDGSEEAAGAIACAGQLLAPRPAMVANVHYGLPHHPLEGWTVPVAEGAEESGAAARQESQTLAAHGTQLAVQAGFAAEPISLKEHGREWQTLLLLAAERDVGVIVAGARGRSALATAVLGSASNGLVQHSSVPVLVVPRAASSDRREGPALLCHDGSNHSARAIASSAELLSVRGALVVNLWESWSDRPIVMPPISGVAGMARELDEQAAQRSRELAAEGSELAAEAGFDAASLSETCRGSCWRDILRAATKEDAVVVVAGSRGFSGLSAVLGSVSNGIVHHADRPVLVVPDREE